MADTDSIKDPSSGRSFSGHFKLTTKSYVSGWHIHGESGNQVPTKYISSGKFFGRIHTLPQCDRASLTKESNFFWLELISFDNNWFPVTRIYFLWPKLLSFNNNISIYCDKIYSSWIKIIYFRQNLCLSQGKYFLL